MTAALRLFACTAPLVAVFFAVVTQPALAAPSPVASSSAHEFTGDIAYSPLSDRFLVVWTQANGLTDSDIYGRLLHGDGTPAGAAFPIAADGDTLRFRPRIAYNATDDEFFVAYEFVFSDSDIDIHGAVLKPDGSFSVADTNLVTTAQVETAPAVAWGSSENEYLLVWQLNRNPPLLTDADIRAERREPDLTPIGGQSFVATTTDDETFPDVAYASSRNEFLVAFEHLAPGSDFDVLAQRVDAVTGAALGNVVDVVVAPGHQFVPRMAFGSGRNEYVVAWEDHRAPVISGSDIYGRRIDDDGGLSFAEFIVSGELQANSRHIPAIAYLPDVDEFLVAWAQDFSDTDTDIGHVRLGSDGVVRGSEDKLSARSTDENFPAVSRGPAPFFAAAWSDDRNEPSGQGTDVYFDLIRVPRFTGRAFETTAGGDFPLREVRIDLFCSVSEASLGDLAATVDTDPLGEYAVVAPVDCAWYHLFATPPAGFATSAATSAGGTVVASEWIRFAHPLTGVDLDDNEFFFVALATTTATTTATPSTTPTPSNTPTFSVTPTATHTPSANPTLTPTATATDSPTLTPAATSTGTPTATSTATTIPTVPATATRTLTATATVPPTAQPTAIPTATTALPPTSTPTEEATPAPTSSPTASVAPTHTPGLPCAGDCNGDGDVTVDEIITLLNIALGTRPVGDCLAGDLGGDGTITVDEIVTAVNRALAGCSA